MSGNLDFIAYCLEEYKAAWGMTGKEVIALFKKYNINDYIISCYGALHTMGGLAIAEEIHSLIEDMKEEDKKIKLNTTINKSISAIQNELNLITNIIKANTTPESIYLFGSYANGVPDSDSDIDIYVVVPDSETDTIELSSKICLDLARKKTLPIDLLIGKKSIFENRMNRLTMENIIAKEGVKIYG